MIHWPIDLFLIDITDAVPYFFGKDVEIDPEAQEKTLDTDTAQDVLKDFVSNLAS